MIDYISREEVLNVICTALDDGSLLGSSLCDGIVDTINSLHPLERIERSKGKRIRKEVVFGWDIFNCSECGEEIGLSYNYCPHCGADMREVADTNVRKMEVQDDK